MNIMSHLPEATLAAAADRLPDLELDLFNAGKDASERFNLAIVRDDLKAAELARIDYDAVLWKLNGRTNFGVLDGDTSPGKRMAEFCKAPDGAPFGWCQKGAFIVEVDGIRAVLTSAGGFSLGGQRAWHIIDLDKPFFSNTGYMSYLNAPIIWGATVEQAAAIWLRNVITKERKLAVIPKDAFARTHPTDWSSLSPMAISKHIAKDRLPVGGYSYFPL